MIASTDGPLDGRGGDALVYEDIAVQSLRVMKTFSKSVSSLQRLEKQQ